jgi:hypothetical protein
MNWNKQKDMEYGYQYSWLKKNKTPEHKYWIKLSIYFLNEVRKYLLKANEPMMSMRVGSIVSQLEMVNGN